MTEISKVKGISGVHLFDMQGRLMEWVGGGQKTDLSPSARAVLDKRPFYDEVIFSESLQ